MERDAALKKMLHYCNYQDRCEKEILSKLNSLDVNESDASFIMNFLREEGFVNDERYCRSFVKGKLNLKKWGVNKIKLSLIAKGVDKNIIDGVISEIDLDIYKEELQNLLRNKKIDETDPYKRNAKLIRYAMSKGYSCQDVMEAMSVNN
ncbi:MAG: RecX family transcriptional regulator [Bacteroidales bacterium]|nr:RecX family transcriptional regulator [Bacteroidales bacterium]